MTAATLTIATHGNPVDGIGDCEVCGRTMIAVHSSYSQARTVCSDAFTCFATYMERA